jgi:hypothetical protein
MTGLERKLEFDSQRHVSIVWGVWFEFAGFNGFMAREESVRTGVRLSVSAVGFCPKEVAMTDSGFRTLMLFVVACASLSAMSDAKADETRRTVSTAEKATAIQIVPGVPQASEAVKVVIAPAGQTTEEDDAPILVAPYEENQSEQGNAEKKPAKRRAKAKSVTKKREAEKAKSAPKSKPAAPIAKETASEKARAEWQKKRSLAKAAPKSARAVSEKAARAAAGDQKREMIEDGPSAGAVASAKASTAASKTGHSASASAQKDSRTYREIYNSIPFSRAEYNANPAYRHQATMEIMLGQLHPIIVAPLAPPRQETTRDITVRFLPAIRPGYRPYSQYPWH